MRPKTWKLVTGQEKARKKSKPDKKSALGRLAKGVALFVIYAAVYPKIAERLGYLMSDFLSGRRSRI